MPQQREVVKCEWKVCWKWIFPYPCKRCRTVTQWCYQFTSVKDQCFVFREKHCGCENGREFCWWDGCFGWFTAWRFGVTVCVDNQLEDKGPCSSSSIPHGEVPGSPRWIGDGVAIGGQALTASDQGGDQSAEFSPPLEVRETCTTCIVLRTIIVVLALFGLWAVVNSM